MDGSGVDAAADKALEAELLRDEKERAEHIMLVDLGRNDLNRVCEPASVHVPRLMKVDYFSHVMHIVSVVKGRLRHSCTPLDAFRSVFPAGTVSGAPKLMAIEHIYTLEGERRGLYGEHCSASSIGC
jgi:anthranilate synthase component 1